MRQIHTKNAPFGGKLRELLDARAYPQSHLADQLSISRARVNNYIAGRSEPDYATLKQIANILDTSIDFLLGNTQHQYMEITYSMGATPDFVAKRDVHDESMMCHDEWIHIYHSQHAIPSKHSASLYEPIGWIRHKSSNKVHHHHNNLYALYVQDDSMHSSIMRGDIVYVQPTVMFHNFIPALSSNNIYAVRLHEQDPIGLSIKKCYSRDDLLIFFCDNGEYAPFLMHIRKVLFSPIVGQVICLWRSCTHDNIFNISVGDI